MKKKLQTIKEEAIQKNVDVVPDNNDFKLPRLEITEKDRDQYLECTASGATFSQRFLKEELGIDVVFRDKTKKESDIISRQVDKAYNDGKMMSVQEYTNIFNYACLYYQLEAINGVTQNRSYPIDVWDMKDFNLLSEIDKSAIGQFSSSKIYILMGLMTQFNQKLFDLSREILSANFSTPVKGS
jgi:hypothetical protein